MNTATDVSSVPITPAAAPNSTSAATSFRSVWTELRETAFRQGWVNAGGINTRYVQAGPEDGPPLLMVHGTGGSWECFCANLKAFSRDYNCYAFDTLGTGFSDKPDIDYGSIEKGTYVQDVIPNPAYTPFLQEAEKRGLKWQSGMQMLINQAALNITMWTGLKPDKDVMRKAFEEAVS